MSINEPLKRGRGDHKETHNYVDVGVSTMGFWRRNWEKISADTISGLSVRVIAGTILLILGVIIVPKFVSLPADNEITKELIDLVYKICFMVYGVLLFFLPKILDWSNKRREARIRESESKNEGLRLQKEILELEIQRDKQQSSHDEENT